MPRLFLPQLQQTLDVESSQTLMDALLKAKIPVASSCKGDGVCGKCRLRVKATTGQLPAMTDSEARLHQKLSLSSNQRISCQLLVMSDLEVEAGYW